MSSVSTALAMEKAKDAPFVPSPKRRFCDLFFQQLPRRVGCGSLHLLEFALELLRNFPPSHFSWREVGVEGRYHLVSRECLARSQSRPR